MPAGALIWLVSGRLDADHTRDGVTEERTDRDSVTADAKQSGTATNQLQRLRPVFPGV
jgi:hypothetical protein